MEFLLLNVFHGHLCIKIKIIGVISFRSLKFIYSFETEGQFWFKNIYTTTLKHLENVAFGVVGFLFSIRIFTFLGVDNSTNSGQV
jgi:hypothetical protein